MAGARSEGAGAQPQAPTGQPQALYRKLGHRLPAVRDGALRSLCFKLENGLLDPAAAGAQPELLRNASQWLATSAAQGRANPSLLGLLSQLADATAIARSSLLRLGCLDSLQKCAASARDEGARKLIESLVESLERAGVECKGVAVSSSPATAGGVGNGGAGGGVGGSAVAPRGDLATADPALFDQAQFRVGDLVDPSNDIKADSSPLFAKLSRDARVRSRMRILMANVGFNRCFQFPEVALTREDSRYLFDVGLKLRTRHVSLVQAACTAARFIAMRDFPPEAALQSPNLLAALISAAKAPRQSIVSDEATSCLKELFERLRESARQFETAAPNRSGQSSSAAAPKSAQTKPTFRYPQPPTTINQVRLVSPVVPEVNAPLAYAAHLVLSHLMPILKERSRAVALGPLLNAIEPCLFPPGPVMETRNKRRTDRSVVSDPDLARADLYLLQFDAVLDALGFKAVLREPGLSGVLSLVLRVAEWRLKRTQSVGNGGAARDKKAVRAVPAPFYGDEKKTDGNGDSSAVATTQSPSNGTEKWLTAGLAKSLALIAAGGRTSALSRALLNRILALLRSASPRFFAAFVQGKAVINAISLTGKIIEADNSRRGDRKYEPLPLRAVQDSLLALPHVREHVPALVAAATGELVSGDSKAREAARGVVKTLLTHASSAVRALALGVVANAVRKGGRGGAAIADCALEEKTLNFTLHMSLRDETGDDGDEGETVLDSAWALVEALSVSSPDKFRQLARPFLPVLSARIGARPRMGGLLSLVSTGAPPARVLRINAQGLFHANATARSAAARAMRSYVAGLIATRARAAPRVQQRYAQVVAAGTDPLQRVLGEGEGEGAGPSAEGKTAASDGFSLDDARRIANVYCGTGFEAHLRREAACQLVALGSSPGGATRFAPVLLSEPVLGAARAALTRLSDADAATLAPDAADQTAGQNSLLKPSLQILLAAARADASERARRRAEGKAGAVALPGTTESSTRPLWTRCDMLQLCLPFVYAANADAAQAALILVAWEAFRDPALDPEFIATRGFSRAREWVPPTPTRAATALVRVPQSLAACYVFPFPVETVAVGRAGGGAPADPARGAVVEAMLEADKHGGGMPARVAACVEAVRLADSYGACMDAATRLASCAAADPDVVAKAFWSEDSAWTAAFDRFLLIRPASRSDAHLFATLLGVLSAALAAARKAPGGAVPSAAAGKLFRLAARLLTWLPPRADASADALKNPAAMEIAARSRLAVLEFLQSLARYAACMRGRDTQCDGPPARAGRLGADADEDPRSILDTRGPSMPMSAAFDGLRLAGPLLRLAGADVGVDMDAAKPWALALRTLALETIFVVTSTDAFPRIQGALSRGAQPIIGLLATPTGPHAFALKAGVRMALRSVRNLLVIAAGSGDGISSDDGSTVNCRASLARQLLFRDSKAQPEGESKADSGACDLPRWLVTLSMDRQDSVRALAYRTAGILLSLAANPVIVVTPRAAPNASALLSNALSAATVRGRDAQAAPVRAAAVGALAAAARGGSRLDEGWVREVAASVDAALVAAGDDDSATAGAAAALLGNLLATANSVAKPFALRESTYQSLVDALGRYARLASGATGTDGTIAYWPSTDALPIAQARPAPRLDAQALWLEAQPPAARAKAVAAVCGAQIMRVLRRLVDYESGACVDYMLSSPEVVAGSLDLLQALSNRGIDPGLARPDVRLALRAFFELHLALVRARPDTYTALAEDALPLLRLAVAGVVSAETDGLPREAAADAAAVRRAAMCFVVALTAALQAQPGSVTAGVSPATYDADAKSASAVARLKEDADSPAVVLQRALMACFRRAVDARQFASAANMEALLKSDGASADDGAVALLASATAAAFAGPGAGDKQWLSDAAGGDEEGPVAWLVTQAQRVYSLLCLQNLEPASGHRRVELALVRRLEAVFTVSQAAMHSASSQVKAAAIAAKLPEALASLFTVLCAISRNRFSSVDATRTPFPMGRFRQQGAPATAERRVRGLTRRRARSAKHIWWDEDGRRHVELSAATPTKGGLPASSDTPVVDPDAPTPVKEGRGRSRGRWAQQGPLPLDQLLWVVANMSRGDVAAKEAFSREARGGSARGSVTEQLASLVKSIGAIKSLPPSTIDLACECLRSIAMCEPAVRALIKAKFCVWAWKAATQVLCIDSKASADTVGGGVEQRARLLLQVLASVAYSRQGATHLGDILIPRQKDVLRRLLANRGQAGVDGFELLRNLCFVPSIKSTIVSDAALIDAMLHAFDPSPASPSRALAALRNEKMRFASHALWSCVYDNQKARALLRRRRAQLSQIQEQLSRETNGGKVGPSMQAVLENVKTLAILCVKDASQVRTRAETTVALAQA